VGERKKEQPNKSIGNIEREGKVWKRGENAGDMKRWRMGMVEVGERFRSRPRRLRSDHAELPSLLRKP
jgi:hypothetical protein